MDSVIILDSSDEESSATPAPLSPTTASIKRKLSTDITLTKLDKSNGDSSPIKKIRRIQPTKISDDVSVIPISNAESSSPNTFRNDVFFVENDLDDSDLLCELENSHNKGKRGRKRRVPEPAVPNVTASLRDSHEDLMLIHEPIANPMHRQASPASVIVSNINNNNNEKNIEAPSTASVANVERNVEKTPINASFAELLKVCREADPSSDMNRLIDKKLIKYYETVHPDFVNSKSFIKNVTAVTLEIRTAPSLVYLKLATILEELNIRRKSGSTVMANEEVTTTGDIKKDKQIKRLNKALYILKRRIAKLEEAEVDFDNENQSSYVLVERYKKRACEIYEKICEITGESKHAQRIVKKPIKFSGTGYTEFNRTIEKFVNQTNTFPDFFDVMRCMEHCNSQHGYKLRIDDMKKIGQDAFMKIGKLLQNRRRTDLYETVSYFTGAEKDPATLDPTLKSKLESNKKHYSKISDIINKYAEEPPGKAQEASDESLPSTSATVTGKKLPSSSAACTSANNPLVDDAKDDEIDTKLGIKMSPASTLTSPLSSPEVEPSMANVSVSVAEQKKPQSTEVPPTNVAPAEMDTIDLNDDDPIVNGNLVISCVSGADDETIIFL